MELAQQAINNLIKALQFQPWPRSDWKWPVLQSHRGYWIEGKMENSLEALAQSKARGYGMAEIDVRLSSDGIPVLYHDSNLKRLTKSHMWVSEVTAAELEQLGIPTLSEVLATSHRPEKINVEIKKEDFKDSELEYKVIEVVKASKKEDEILFSSFNPVVLGKLAKELPDIPRALLIEMDSIKWASYLRLSGNVVAKAHMVNWPYKLLNKEIVETLKNAGVPVATWTVNDYRDAKNLLAYGVDSLISDRLTPEMLTMASSYQFA
jgi:glycerophosphoryl diester phosphodiesterase